MPFLGARRIGFNLPAVSVRCSLRPCSLPRLFYISHSSSIVIQTRWPPRRVFSAVAHPFNDIFGMSYPRNDLFEYTSGRWIFNDKLRHAECRRVFNVDGLSRLAAESVNRSVDDIVSLDKLDEREFGRSLLITMCCGFKMVAYIPYLVPTTPRYFAIASKVATMAFLRSSGLPIPQVYGYSPVPNNAAETEYVFMEFVQGANLNGLLSGMGEWEIASIFRQLAELESKIMSIVFPAGGSLYYTKDLEDVPGSVSGCTTPGVTLEDKRFCVGPDTSRSLWYGRRSQLDLNRGPYQSAEAALVGGAKKELAFLRQFGRPLLPFERLRREGYDFQKQPPSHHIENLNRYLRIAPSLIPRDPAIGHFSIRHPDLEPRNIVVSRSPNSTWHIVSLINWQYTSILPLFLLAGIHPDFAASDTNLESKTRPSLPENLDSLDEMEQKAEMHFYLRRLVEHHYVTKTEKYNELHYAALMEPMSPLRGRLFHQATSPWDGETLELKVALIQATEDWKALSGGDAPCPVVFDPDDVRETTRLDAKQREMDEILAKFRFLVGCETGGWVPAKNYEKAMDGSKSLKEDVLATAETEEERALLTANWLLDDMAEEEYM